MSRSRAIRFILSGSCLSRRNATSMRFKRLPRVFSNAPSAKSILTGRPVPMIFDRSCVETNLASCSSVSPFGQAVASCCLLRFRRLAITFPPEKSTKPLLLLRRHVPRCNHVRSLLTANCIHDQQVPALRRLTPCKRLPSLYNLSQRRCRYYLFRLVLVHAMACNVGSVSFVPNPPAYPHVPVLDNLVAIGLNNIEYLNTCCGAIHAGMIVQVT